MSVPFAAAMPALARPLEPYRVVAADGELLGDEPDVSADDVKSLLRWMVFGRELDQRGLQLQCQGRLTVWGPMVGQEAAQAGLGLAMRAGDLIFPSYRETITLCMRGLDLADLLNYYRGLYWTADPLGTGVYPIQIVIGDQSLHAVGAGIGFALQGQAHVAVAAIGDGATSEGDFHEALNFAGVFRARSVVFIQNNQWAISMPLAGQTASPTLAQKAVGYGIAGVLVDGNDALAVYQVSRWALDHARSGAGPVLVEALTYRVGAHTTADDPRRYQPTDEVEAWRARDPLVRLRQFARRRALWDDGDEAAAKADALSRLDEAMARAEGTPTPPVSRIFETTFASPTPALRGQAEAVRAPL